MTLPGRHPLYQPVRDLPGSGGAIRLGIDAELDGGALTVGTTETLSAPTVDMLSTLVGAEQFHGGELELKVDGAWCALTLSGGAVVAATSRSANPLHAGVPWLGAEVDRRLDGWSIIGELEAGTSRAHAARRARGELGDDGRSLVAPLLHVYGVHDPDGRDRLAELSELPLHPRWRAVERCPDGEAWGDFTADVIQRGDEGVIVRRGDGLWRAKAQSTAERVVCGDRVESDRNGHQVRKLLLGAYPSGRSLRVEHLQWAVAPAWWTIPEARTRRLILEIAHYGDDEGVLRHAAIVGIRTDKRATDVRLTD
jgi:ATP-dependent DNA ligase